MPPEQRLGHRSRRPLARALPRTSSHATGSTPGKHPGMASERRALGIDQPRPSPFRISPRRAGKPNWNLVPGMGPWRPRPILDWRFQQLGPLHPSPREKLKRRLEHFCARRSRWDWFGPWHSSQDPCRGCRRVGHGSHSRLCQANDSGRAGQFQRTSLDSPVSLQVPTPPTPAWRREVGQPPNL